jgi:hypothetical protein
MAMQIADTTPMKETCLSVLGMEKKKHIKAVMTWKTTVHCEWSLRVFKIYTKAKLARRTVITKLDVPCYRSGRESQPGKRCSESA